MTYEEFNQLIERVEENGESALTADELEKLAPYKVDNAIIMAAGYSARCMPLSNVMPKGLFRVKGEILIEREIEQLLEVGIEKIIVVTGFLAEKFEKTARIGKGTKNLTVPVPFRSLKIGWSFIM